jgi:thioester reductase-like protein
VLSADAEWDLEIVAGDSRSADASIQVLLTGATGFLGAYLLRELLLQDTAVRVQCLVRARDEREASARVRNNLIAHACWDDAFAARITAVPGDLSLPRLGLDERVWQDLARHVDAIYHNGALVNSVLPYEKLAPVNVGGTKELLRLAAEQRTKEFHYISSDAVFEAYGYHRQATIYETEPLAHGDSIYGGGYSESKWVAEKLVAAARERGLPARIYRPGTIAGDAVNGNGQTDDFFARFISGILQMQICPDIDATIDLAPVDHVARNIVRLSRQPGAGDAFHLTHENPITYEQLIDTIRELGFTLRVVPYHEWQAALASIRYEDGNALYPMLSVFTESSAPIFRKARLDSSNTRRGLESNQQCPAIVDLIRLYLARFTEQGELPSAPR